MESILLSTDPAKAFGDIFKRIQRLEQGISSTSTTGSGNGVFDTITLGPSGNQVTLNIVPPSAPTGITATPGAFEDLSFVDVDWVAQSGATSYQTELAENVAGVRSIVDQGQGIATNYRFDNLNRTKNYSVRVASLNRVGITGAFSAWVDFTPVADLFGPAAPTGVAFARGATSVIAKWNQNAEPDVKNGHGLYAVELSTLSDFSAILRTARIGGTIAVFNDLTTETTYYVRVAAIDSSGNQGPWTIASGISGGIVGSMILADQIYSSHVQVNTLEGDRIKANTINVTKLLADSILAKNINIGAGGQFKVGNAPAGGMVINSQGISLYNSSGARTIYLNALDGAGTFTGTISGSTVTGSTIIGGSFQTASAGRRIVMASTDSSKVTFFSGLSSETVSGRLEFTDSGSSVGTGIGQRTSIFLETAKVGSTRKTSKLEMESEDSNGVTIARLKAFAGVGTMTVSDGVSELRCNQAYCLLYTNSAELSCGTAHVFLFSNIAQLALATDRWMKIDASAAKLQHDQKEFIISTAGMKFFDFGYECGRFYSLTGESHLQINNLRPSSTDSLVRWNTQTGEFAYDSSSEKTKQAIGPLAETYDATSIIDLMRPIAYEEADREKGGKKPYRYIGLSAEALYEFAPQLVCCDTQGDAVSILYDKISVVAIAGVKDLRARVAQLEDFISKMSPKEAE